MLLLTTHCGEQMDELLLTLRASNEHSNRSDQVAIHRYHVLYQYCAPLPINDLQSISIYKLHMCVTRVNMLAPIIYAHVNVLKYATIWAQLFCSIKT